MIRNNIFTLAQWVQFFERKNILFKPFLILESMRRLDLFYYSPSSLSLWYSISSPEKNGLSAYSRRAIINRHAVNKRDEGFSPTGVRTFSRWLALNFHGKAFQIKRRRTWAFSSVFREHVVGAVCEHGERGVLIFHCRFGARCYARRNIRGYYVSRASQVSWLNGAVIYAEPSSLEIKRLKFQPINALRFLFLPFFF